MTSVYVTMHGNSPANFIKDNTDSASRNRSEHMYGGRHRDWPRFWQPKRDERAALH